MEKSITWFLRGLPEAEYVLPQASFADAIKKFEQKNKKQPAPQAVETQPPKTCSGRTVKTPAKYG
jgi:hypothetical protein